MKVDAISSGLRRGDDGIWYSREAEPVSYPSEGYARCLAVEEGSFWFHHRNRCIVAAVGVHPPPGEGTIFDVGGGNGFVSMALARAGFQVALVEPGREAAANAKRRGVATVVCATLDEGRFASGALPACGLFDVLEHVGEDIAFLRSVRDVLVPGGKLYATVPAYPFLWSHEDELAGHYRRYTLKGFEATLRAAGLQVSFSTYFFRFLPAAIFLTRTLPHRLGAGKNEIDLKLAMKDHLSSNGRRSRALTALLASEVDNIARRRPMRFGGSCLAVAARF